MLEPETVVEHEFGHQYWYGMVATNEFEDAWMDEGINSYMEAKVMDALYGKDTSVCEFAAGHARRARHGPIELRSMADRDPLSRPAWLFEDDGSYGGDHIFEDGADDADAGEPDRRKDGACTDCASTLSATSSSIRRRKNLRRR